MFLYPAIWETIKPKTAIKAIIGTLKFRAEHDK